MQNKNFLLSSFLAASFMMAVYIYYPFLAPYLVTQGFAKEQISLIFSIAPFILIITSVILGKISDDVGRKRIINASLLLEMVAMILYLLTKNNFFILIAAIILSAIAINGHQLAILQSVEDNIKSARGKLTGIFESIQSIGILIGPIIGTFVISFLPINTVFKVAFIFLLALLVLNNLKREGGHASLDKEDFNFIGGIKEFWNTRGLRGIGILGMAMHFSLPATAIFIPIFIMEDLGGTIRDVGFFASIWGAVHLLQFLSGYLCDKRSGRKVVLASTSIFALFMLSLYLVPDVLTMLLVSIGFGLFSGFWNTGAWYYMSEIGESIKKEGLVTGSYVSIAKIGGVVGFLVSGLISVMFGVRILFVVYGLVIIFSVLLSRKYLIKLSSS